MRAAFLLVAVALAAGSGCVSAEAPARGGAEGERPAPGGATMRIDASASGTRVRLRPGDALELVLAETPSTGHRWKLVSAGDPVVRLDADRFDPPGPTPGAPGSHLWKFTVAQAGSARLELVYVRPFGSAPPARRFELEVDAQ